jgi:hypothetical protein
MTEECISEYVAAGEAGVDRATSAASDASDASDDAADDEQASESTASSNVFWIVAPWSATFEIDGQRYDRAIVRASMRDELTHRLPLGNARLVFDDEDRIMANNVDHPLVVVAITRTAATDANFVVIDGAHLLERASREGRPSIYARLVPTSVLIRARCVGATSLDPAPASDASDGKMPESASDESASDEQADDKQAPEQASDEWLTPEEIANLRPMDVFRVIAPKLASFAINGRHYDREAVRECMRDERAFELPIGGFNILFDDDGEPSPADCGDHPLQMVAVTRTEPHEVNYVVTDGAHLLMRAIRERQPSVRVRFVPTSTLEHARRVWAGTATFEAKGGAPENLDPHSSPSQRGHPVLEDDRRSGSGALPQEYLHVVSDSHGFVGAFDSEAGARERAFAPFSLTPFIVQRFPVAAGPRDRVWVVLYRDIDAVAFVSNDRAAAERWQQALGRVGLSYPDSIDYWEHPVGALARAAEERLQAIRRAHSAEPDVAEMKQRERDELARLEGMMNPNPDGPLARLLREEERVSIIDAVVSMYDSGDTAPDSQPDGASCSEI